MRLHSLAAVLESSSRSSLHGSHCPWHGAFFLGPSQRYRWFRVHNDQILPVEHHSGSFLALGTVWNNSGSVVLRWAGASRLPWQGFSGGVWARWALPRPGWLSVQLQAPVTVLGRICVRYKQTGARRHVSCHTGICYPRGKQTNQLMRRVPNSKLGMEHEPSVQLLGLFTAVPWHQHKFHIP